MFTVSMFYDKELPLSNHTTLKREIQTEIITQVSINSYTIYSEDCRDLGMSIKKECWLWNQWVTHLLEIGIPNYYKADCYPLLCKCSKQLMT